MKQHKYKPVTKGKDNKSLIIYCEYCGHLTYWDESNQINYQSKDPCQLSPKPIVQQIGEVLERLIKLENEIE